MPARDPICSVVDCSRPTDGVLTVTTPQGSVTLSACQSHGQRATEGEWFVFTLLGCKYILGPSGATLPPAQYQPLRPDW